MSATHPSDGLSPGVPSATGRTGRLLPAVLAPAVAAALVLSALGAKEPGTWVLETVWVMLGLPVLFLLQPAVPAERDALRTAGRPRPRPHGGRPLHVRRGPGR